MISFFGIFIILLFVNALLLFFSLKGASQSAKKTSKSNQNPSIPKLYLKQESKVIYKKAV